MKMGINDSFSNWLKGAKSTATSTLRAAHAQVAALQQQTMTAVSGAQRAVQQVITPRSSTPSPHTTKTLIPTDLIEGAARAVQGGAMAALDSARGVLPGTSPVSPLPQQGRSLGGSAPVQPSASPAATPQSTSVPVRSVGGLGPARALIATRSPSTPQRGGPTVTPSPIQPSASPFAVASQSSSAVARSVGGAGPMQAMQTVQRAAASQVVSRAVQATPLALPVAAAQALPGAVQAGKDIMGYSAAIDRYKTQEAALQRTYAAQQPLYDRYAQNVKAYETSRERYDQMVSAYQANPTARGFAEVRALEGPLRAQYEQIQRMDNALTPLWQQSEAADSARKEAEQIQRQDRGTFSAAIVDALGAARMGTTPPASRQTATRTEQAALYGVYPAAMGFAEQWRSGVVEPFQRTLSEATGGQDLVVSQSAIDVVRHPVTRGAITALAPGMASTPLAMDLVVGAKQWAGHSPEINVSRLARGVVGAPADLVEMGGMAVPGAEMAVRRVVERPSDLAYLPVAGLTYMGAGMVESFKQDPEGTVGSLAGMGLLTHGIGRVSAIPAARVGAAVRPRITEARIASQISPVDRPAFHAVSTIGRGIEGIRSDVLAEPRFGEVLNVGVDRAPRLANVLADTPHSVYGSATRTGQMRPGSVLRQAQDVDVFTPDVPALNLRIAREFGPPYTVEGSTVVRDVPGVGRVHAIDTHAIPEGYPLPGGGRGLKIQYEDAKVAPELPFDWMPKDLLKTGRITQEHLYTQVQRKAASVAGEPVKGGGWRFGPEEYRMGKDVFDLVSDAEYLISVEELRLPGMNPARRALVSRRLRRLREAVEEIKKSPTLSKAYQTELQKARASLEAAAAEDGPILRISAVPAPAPRSPAMRAPAVLSFPAVSALVSSDAGWVADLPRASGTVVPPSPSRAPASLPAILDLSSPYPSIAGRETSSSILNFGSPSMAVSPAGERPAPSESPARASPTGGPSVLGFLDFSFPAPGPRKASPQRTVPPAPYRPPRGPARRSPSPYIVPPPLRPSAPPSRARRRREDDERRRRRREYQYKPHWEFGPAPGTKEMAGMIFGSGGIPTGGSLLDFGSPLIGVSGTSPDRNRNKPAHAGEKRSPTKKRAASKKKK